MVLLGGVAGPHVDWEDCGFGKGLSFEPRSHPNLFSDDVGDCKRPFPPTRVLLEYPCLSARANEESRRGYNWAAKHLIDWRIASCLRSFPENNGHGELSLALSRVLFVTREACKPSKIEQTWNEPVWPHFFL